MKKAALHNLGCKVNAYETEAMQEMLEQNGYEIVPFGQPADVYVINTCTVTNTADKKSRQMLHRARKMNPDAVVVAAGCYVQAKASEVDECIDIVIGNNRKKDLIRILEQYRGEENRESCERKPYADLKDISCEREFENLSVSGTPGHTRAYIKVQDGCNQFCTYCIIPYVRGRVRSRSQASVAGEVADLAEHGFKEIVLTGIHLSSYGIDTEDSLLGLIRNIHEIKGIRRIRLGSLEPGLITEEFVRAASDLDKLCPHFHLSLQSGCDATLARMNRRYRAEEYFDKCELLRRYFLNPALTTDVIVGFPGETEQEFEESKAFIDRVGFYQTHIFKYSKRKGTKAAAMEGQVPEEIKNIRSAELIELSRRKEQSYEERLVGRTEEVLVEEEMMIDGQAYQVGHTKEYVKIGKKTSENYVNQLINVEIENSLQIIH